MELGEVVEVRNDCILASGVPQARFKCFISGQIGGNLIRSSRPVKVVFYGDRTCFYSRIWLSRLFS